MISYITHAQLAEDLALRDLSNPAEGPHAMQNLLTNVVDALGTEWSIPAKTVRHSPIVPVENNYDRLGFDPGAVTRDQRYSRYLSPTVMLRSHTSASVPWLLTDTHGRVMSMSLSSCPALYTDATRSTAPMSEHRIRWTSGESRHIHG